MTEKTPFAKLSEWELAYKAVPCMLIGLLFTKAIGYPSVMTIPVTAVLVFWANRGTRGTVAYFGFRMRIQFLFVLVDVGAWRLSKMIAPNLDSLHRMVILSLILIPIGLQVYYRFKIIPMELGAAFSQMIILSGLMAYDDYGYRRLLWNFCGLCIGSVAAFLLPRASKIERVDREVKKISGASIAELKRMGSAGELVQSEGFVKGVPAVQRDLEAINGYMAVVNADHTHSAKAPMSWFPDVIFTAKYAKYAGMLPLCRKELAALNALNALLSHMRASAKPLSRLKEERRALFLDALMRAAGAHEALLSGTGEEKKAPELPALLAENEDEVLLLEKVQAYAAQVQALAA